eukprot:1184645-Amphidinium_carterae.1
MPLLGNPVARVANVGMPDGMDPRHSAVFPSSQVHTQLRATPLPSMSVFEAGNRHVTVVLIISTVKSSLPAQESSNSRVKK